MHKGEAAYPHEVPKSHQTLWALNTHKTGNECPLLGLPMPDTWSLNAHLTGTVSPFNGLYQTVLCAFIPNSACQSFLLFPVCIYILYILKR